MTTSASVENPRQLITRFARQELERYQRGELYYVSTLDLIGQRFNLTRQWIQVILNQELTQEEKDLRREAFKKGAERQIPEKIKNIQQRNKDIALKIREELNLFWRGDLDHISLSAEHAGTFQISLPSISRIISLYLTRAEKRQRRSLICLARYNHLIQARQVILRIRNQLQAVAQDYQTFISSKTVLANHYKVSYQNISYWMETFLTKEEKAQFKWAQKIYPYDQESSNRE